MDRKELGALGEKLACDYLVDKGFSIVGKNYRITFGELDIVAKRKDILHFVEVKTIAHSGGVFYAEDRVDYKKQRKLRSMAQIWLSKNNYPQDIPYQIDIIAISANSGTRMAKLHYFPNAIEG